MPDPELFKHNLGVAIYAKPRLQSPFFPWVRPAPAQARPRARARSSWIKSAVYAFFCARRLKALAQVWFV